MSAPVWSYFILLEYYTAQTIGKRVYKGFFPEGSFRAGYYYLIGKNGEDEPWLKMLNYVNAGNVEIRTLNLRLTAVFNPN